MSFIKCLTQYSFLSHVGTLKYPKVLKLDQFEEEKNDNEKLIEFVCLFYIGNFSNLFIHF